MSDALLIRGGTLIDASGSRRGDLGVLDGVVVPPDEVPTGAHEIEADGCIVSTGLVDLHAHLGEPGDEAAETVATAAQAAVRGGYTTVVAMPNTLPPVDNAAVVEHIRSLAEATPVKVEVAGTVTVGGAGERLAPLGELAAAGVRLVTDPDTGVQDPLLLRRALEYSVPLGLVVAQACECAALSAGGQMHEGEWSGRLGLRGIPAEAEEVNVMRDISLVRLTGARLHFQTLSTAGSFAIVSAAAQSGLPVSAEVTAHHMRLCDAELASYDTHLKVRPPLRSEGDARAAMTAVEAGRVDVIVTDHTPLTTDRKECPFDDAVPGTVGLETTLAASLGTGIDPAILLRALSWRPAELLGLGSPQQRSLQTGAPADLVVIDPRETWTPRVGSMATLGTNCAFEGSRLTGRVRATIVDGRLVLDQGKVAA